MRAHRVNRDPTFAEYALDASPCPRHRFVAQVVIGFNRAAKEIAVIDPADGWRQYSFEAFAQEWAGAQALTMVVSPPTRR